MNNKFITVLTSRKFLATLVALGFAFLGERVGMDQETVNKAIYVLISYIVGQGLADINAK